MSTNKSFRKLMALMSTAGCLAGGKMSAASPSETQVVQTESQQTKNVEKEKQKERENVNTKKSSGTSTAKKACFRAKKSILCQS